MVWPLVVGAPVPTVPMRTAVPEPVETYSCPPNRLVCRRLVTVALSAVAVVAPNAA